MSKIRTHTVTFPLTRQEDWKETIPRKLLDLQPGLVILDCLDWFLNCTDFQKIQILFNQAGLTIILIQSSIPETIVSASAIGLPATLKIASNEKESKKSLGQNFHINENPSVLFKKGTLRSGESLEAEGDVLLLGDVNPGAKISAGGNVMVWGRLRGVAHAGKTGNTNAKIVALQLRPLQLRIAQAIARGPQEKPLEGFAEEALIESGQIVIKPAKAHI